MTDNTGKKHTDFTESSIIGSILRMGLPSMFGFLSQNIYAFVDTYWVSQLPEKESGVAAITFFAAILWAFFSFNQLIGPGSVAIISRRYGEKNYQATERAIKETIILKLFFGFLFGIIGYFYVNRMLILLGAEGEALEMGTAYGRIMFIGMGIMYATYSYFTAMRGVANPQMAMILMIGSNLLNAVLDPIFIFGYFGLPAWGIEGAAIATVLSYAITFAIGTWLFVRGATNVRLTMRIKNAMGIDTMWKLIKIGIPSWLGAASMSGARLVITPMIAAYGTGVVAAYGVGNQVFSFALMALVGIGLGLSSLIGHNLGSGKSERAKKTADMGILLGVAIMLVAGLVCWLLSRPIMGLFFDNPQTIDIGVRLLKIFAIGFPFLGAFIMLETIHMGVGLNMPSMVMNIIHSWLLEVVPIFFFTRHLNWSQDAIWWTISLAGVITSVIFYVYYRRGRWLTVEV